MYKDDYEKADLKMLTVVEPDGKRTNRQILWHAFLLIPVSLVPVYLKISGMIYFYGALILGLSYLLSGYQLTKQYNIKNARSLLKMSIIYLPVLLTVILFDRIL